MHSLLRSLILFHIHQSTKSKPSPGQGSAVSLPSSSSSSSCPFVLPPSLATMAEAIGTALGVVGILGQLFDGCVKAYGYFTTAANMDPDSTRLLCKVRIEEMRLVVWGREWGVAEGRLEAHLDSERNPQLRALAMQVLRELHGTVTDFRKLKSKYGLVDEANGGGDGGDGEGLDVRGKAVAAGTSPSPSGKGAFRDEGKRLNGSSKSPVPGERGWRKEISLRTKWVIGGMSTTRTPI